MATSRARAAADQDAGHRLARRAEQEAIHTPSHETGPQPLSGEAAQAHALLRAAPAAQGLGALQCAAVQRLQQSYGNQAVQRLLQRQDVAGEQIQPDRAPGDSVSVQRITAEELKRKVTRAGRLAKSAVTSPKKTAAAIALRRHIKKVKKEKASLVDLPDLNERPKREWLPGQDDMEAAETAPEWVKKTLDIGINEQEERDMRV